MEIVAHRGIHDSLPENSLAAFEAAIELGSDVVEFDVRLTRDRVPVVIHSLECAIALDGLNGYLFEHDLSELRAVRLKGSPQRPAPANLDIGRGTRWARRADRHGDRDQGSQRRARGTGREVTGAASPSLGLDRGDVIRALDPQGFS